MEEPVAVVVCAAGSSSRMGGVKKEYLKLDNSAKTVLESVVSAFSAVLSINTIVIAIPENGEAEARAALSPEFFAAERPKLLFVEGGKTRCASVFNALSRLEEYNPHYVLIHDGARPWVNPSLIKKIIEAVKKYGAVIPLLPLAETPKECDTSLLYGNENTPVFVKRHLKRANTGIAQTPQAFRFLEILDAHKKAAQIDNEEFTDDAEIWGRFCGQAAVIPGDPENRKITFQGDLQL